MRRRLRIEPPSTADAAWTLRPIEPADAEAWYGYLSVPAVVEHTSWSVRSADDLRPIIEDCMSDAVDSPIRFAVVRTDDGALAGTIGFPLMSALHRTAEVAYDFHPSTWGRGVATLCCRAVTAWALHRLGCVRVQATTLDTNRASRRVIEKSDFLYEGTLKNLRIVRGEPRDFHLFARTS